MIPLPSQPKVIHEEKNKAVFEIEGLYPGYGQTIGNSLRRTLLSSLRGAAITSIKVAGVGHEFSTMEGISEDAVEIILNFKQVRMKLHEDGPFTITLSEKGEKEVKAGDFATPSQVEVINKDAHIVTLTAKKSSLKIEATVESGLGYVPVEARTKEKVEVGVIALDAVFSPVRHVNYEVENMRWGERTDYNRLRLHIDTDGSISPREAFAQAAEILVKQFNSLAKGFTEKESRPEEGKALIAEAEGEETKSSGDEVLRVKIDDLKLSSRTMNALREAGIKTVGGLARKREESLREIEGMGDKGIQEVKKALGNFGINLRQ
jgi:DNA-directed RNA polymerase subunit alpha